MAQDVTCKYVDLIQLMREVYDPLETPTSHAVNTSLLVGISSLQLTLLCCNVPIVVSQYLVLCGATTIVTNVLLAAVY